MVHRCADAGRAGSGDHRRARALERHAGRLRAPDATWRSTTQVDIARQDGSTAAFRVTRVAHFAKSAFPTEAVYGDIPRPGLRLITCGGLDPDTNSYEENVVVFAVLV